MTIKDAGGVALATSAVGNPYMFTGRRMDSESGLYYFRARYFDSELGRFISRDPLGYVDGMGLYNGYFVPNGVDPMGLWNESGHFYTIYTLARAAGIGHEKALTYATWAQYPDANENYAAAAQFGKPRYLDIAVYFHMLAGGDPEPVRKYVKCLMKSGEFDDVEMGFLMHAFGDTFSHTDHRHERKWDGKGRPNYRDRRDPGWVKGESTVLHSKWLGHGLSGHGPDYIANHKDAYLPYIDRMVQIMHELNPGSTINKPMMDDLRAAVKNMKYHSFSGIEHQNNYEIQQLLDVAKKHGVGYSGNYRPEQAGNGINSPSFPRGQEGWRDWGAKADNLLDKIKKGTTNCCPPKQLKEFKKFERNRFERRRRR